MAVPQTTTYDACINVVVKWSAVPEKGYYPTSPEIAFRRKTVPPLLPPVTFLLLLFPISNLSVPLPDSG